jgi:hexosaminidase
MRFKVLYLFALVVGLAACSQHEKNEAAKRLIPRPVKFYFTDNGSFKIAANTRIIYNSTFPQVASHAEYLASIINKSTGFALKAEAFTESQQLSDYILLSTLNADTALGKEGYKLSCNKGQIVIHAVTDAGVFYGIQSLLQLAPPQIMADSVKQVEWEIPSLQIWDKPRFTYRGMHLDVSRHFFPKDFILKYIDMLAMYKLNVFHWHLTDDNGWRIEIKKYPDLTNIAAWHVDRNNMDWDKVTPPKEGEKATVGGFYTQEEVKEVVAYAAQRHIMVIPEIEMPGHTSEVFAAYPNLSCQGKKLYVQPGTYWPNIDIFCGGNEDVFTFIDDVLTEIVPLFPGYYIHIGGDEADKTYWKKCNKCQAAIKRENLKDEAELQSYFIKRVEKMVIAKGKRMIGWDEILEGGLAPEATVMSWRGVNGGIEAAQQGHDVIMTPTSYCYFDYYQADPEFEPRAIGGFLPLKKVYSFDPIPSVLNQSQAKHVLGVQANIWTEFIPTSQHAEYMAMPRMLALAEIAWTQLDRKDFEDFNKRVRNQFKVFDLMDINYSKGSYKVDIEADYDSSKQVFSVNLVSEQYKPEIRYTTDGSVPVSTSPIFDKPIQVKENTTLNAQIFEDGKPKEKPSSMTITLHKGIGSKLTFAFPADAKYASQGPKSFTNGILASTNLNDGYWLGFEANNLDVTLELASSTDLKLLKLRCLHNPKAWIFLPTSIQVQVSDDGKNFRTFSVNVPSNSAGGKDIAIQEFKIELDNKPAKFVFVKAINQGVCPPDHPNAGGRAWLFVDEVIVE